MATLPDQTVLARMQAGYLATQADMQALSAMATFNLKPPMVLAGLTGTGAAPTANTWTTVPFNMTWVNTDTMFNSGGIMSIHTAGYYAFSYCVRMSAGQVRMAQYFSGANPVLPSGSRGSFVTSTLNSTVSVSGVLPVYMVSGDSVQLQTYQTGTTAGAASPTTQLMLRWVHP